MHRTVRLLPVILSACIMGCGHTNQPSGLAKLPAAVDEFRDALFKMRAELKLGQSDDEYFKNLKVLQFASDKAEAATTPEQRATPKYSKLHDAFQEYLSGYNCMNQIKHTKEWPEWIRIAESQNAYDDQERLVNNLELTANGRNGAIGTEQAKLWVLGVALKQDIKEATPVLEAKTKKLNDEEQAHWAKADQLLSD